MALTDLPTIKLSENGTFLLALTILTFIFFFTLPRQESDD